MSILDRSDLKYDYIWSTKPAIEPRADTNTQNASKTNVFRSGEGDQVLTFLNEYAKSRNISEKEDARNLEPFLQKKLAREDGVTRKELEAWLDEQRKQ